MRANFKNKAKKELEDRIAKSNMGLILRHEIDNEAFTKALGMPYEDLETWANRLEKARDEAVALWGIWTPVVKSGKEKGAAAARKIIEATPEEHRLG